MTALNDGDRLPVSGQHPPHRLPEPRGRPASPDGMPDPAPAGRAVAESEGRFRKLAELLDGVAFCLDHRGVFTWISGAAQTLGWDPAELTGRRYRDFVQPDDRSAPLVRVLTGFGDERWMAAAYASPSDDPDGPQETIGVWRTVASPDPAAPGGQQTTQASEGPLLAHAELDAEACFTHADSGFLSLCGRTAGRLQGVPLARVLAEGEEPVLRGMIRRLVDGIRTHVSFRTALAVTGASPQWVELDLRVRMHDTGQPESFTCRAVALDDLQLIRQELLFRAGHDLLTRLPDLHSFLGGLGALFGSSDGRFPAGVLLCHVEGVGTANAEYGHRIGDGVLVHSAERIVDSLGPHVMAARVGNADLAVALAGSGTPAALEAAASRLQIAFQTPIATEGLSIDTLLSIGGALLRPGELPEDLLARARAAMEKARSTGSGPCTILAEDTGA